VGVVTCQHDEPARMLPRPEKDPERDGDLAEALVTTTFAEDVESVGLQARSAPPLRRPRPAAVRSSSPTLARPTRTWDRPDAL